MLVLTSLALVLVASPGIAWAQDDTIARSLIERLCSAELDDEAAIATCLTSVGAILAGADSLPPEALASSAPAGLLDRARQTADEALASAQQSLRDLDVQGAVDEAVAAARASAQDLSEDIDLQAALDEAVGRVQDVDLQAALDEAVAAAQDVDLQAALDAAVAAAQDVDLQAALDEVLAAADEAVSAAQDVDVEALLAEGVTTTRAVVAEAGAWLTENAEAVCAGSSLSAGTGVAAVVAYLTGSPGLAISAFQQTERISRDICGDVVAAPASPEGTAAQG
jgi:hypothetical protein